LGTVTSPQKIYNLYHTLKNNIQTNIKLSEIPYFLELAKNIKTENITRRVLDNSPSGLLRADISEEGAYILLPRTGDYSELQNLAKNIFVIKNGHEWQPINVIVLNGTKIEGWARDTAGYLSSLNFKVIKTGNTPETTESQKPASLNQGEYKNTDLKPERYLYEKTVIYDLKGSGRKDIISVLRKSLNANVTHVVPEFLQSEIKNYKNVDFLIVLGAKPSQSKNPDDAKLSEDNENSK